MVEEIYGIPREKQQYRYISSRTNNTKRPDQVVSVRDCDRSRNFSETLKLFLALGELIKNKHELIFFLEEKQEQPMDYQGENASFLFIKYFDTVTRQLS